MRTETFAVINRQREIAAYAASVFRALASIIGV